MKICRIAALLPAALLCLLLSAAAGASGLAVAEQVPGMTAEAVSRSGGPEADAVRVTVPFTVKGRHYLLRLLDAEGEILWIGQREGGGLLTFEAVPSPLPEAGAELELILTTDAPGMAPAVIPLTVAPEDAVPVDEGCPKDASCPLSRYRDLDPGAWYHDGIHAMLEKGILNGFDDGTFRPGDRTSRAMLVTMLWRMEGKPFVRYELRFSDAEDGTWYADAVRWAASSGIVGGYDAVTFGTNDPVTREQLAVILYRVSGGGSGGDLRSFGDADSVSPWAAEAVRWAVGRGLLNGRDGMLCPAEPASRAEVAAVLARYAGSGDT